jgi:hypothetical protein
MIIEISQSYLLLHSIPLVTQVASYNFLVLGVGSWGLGVGRFHLCFHSKLQLPTPNSPK